MKYLDYAVTFSEFPDEIALCINISNCPFHCSGCHSSELWEDKGEELNEESLTTLIGRNPGISCIGFMGGNPNSVNDLANFVKQHWLLKIGWYTGYQFIPKEINLNNFDYIKIGPYIKELGGLDNPNTNQKFYAKGSCIHKMDADSNTLYDITDKFWKNGCNN